MFKFKNKTKQIKAPISGKAIDLSKVNDPVFSNRLMGDGIAIEISDDILYAPMDGKIIVIANTLHAIGLSNDDGIEILIHVGLDSVNLNGEGFSILVEIDQKVKVGTPLLKVDRKLLAEKGIDSVTPIIVTNTNNKKVEIVNLSQEVKATEDTIIKY